MEWIKWALYLFSFVSVTRRMLKHPKPSGWAKEPDQD
jgi:hypothetical protein